MTIASGPVRVGIIGFGNWARHGHVRVLELLPGYVLSALHTSRSGSAADAASHFVHVVESVEALVSHPEVDLVVVLNTAPQHASAVRAAIAAGKHVYCEWPLTTSAAVARDLLRAAEKAGVRHVVGLQRRLAPVNRYIQDLVAGGFVGTLRSARLHVSMNYFQALRSVSLRWTVPPDNFSSVVAIYAGHFLDMVLAITGWPRVISGMQVNQFPKVTIEETGEVLDTTTPDQLVLSGVLPGGAVLSVHVEGGKRNGSGVQLDLTGDAGDLRVTNRSAFGGVGDDYEVSGAHGDNLPLAPMPVPDHYDGLPPATLPSAVLELAQLYAAFARDGREGTRTAPDFRDALRMHELLDAAGRSMSEGIHLRL